MRGGVLAAIPLAAALAGCGTSLSEHVGDSFWVTPGKYAYHNCKQLDRDRKAFSTRRSELEELMSRAAQGGTSGQFVGTMAYRSEYQQVLGEQQAITKASAEKRCVLEADSPSGRSVF